MTSRLRGAVEVPLFTPTGEPSRAARPPRPRSRRTDPVTSAEAAEAVTDESWTKAHIVAILDRHGPMTDEELAIQYAYEVGRNGWPPVSPSGLRTRRSELQRDGQVVALSERRRTISGRSATVWALGPGNSPDKTDQTNTEDTP